MLYKSKYRICVEEGPTVDFTLRGMGTYDEEFEKWEEEKKTYRKKQN